MGEHTDHLTAIIDAATCQFPVDCRNGHRPGCLEVRRVRVEYALGEALGDAAVQDRLQEAICQALDVSEVHSAVPIVIEERIADFATDALTEALGGAS